MIGGQPEFSGSRHEQSKTACPREPQRARDAKALALKLGDGCHATRMSWQIFRAKRILTTFCLSSKYYEFKKVIQF
jgi:hypothetical protein